MFSRTTAQHIYCTNTVQTAQTANWTVLTVITQKLPLHVQLHNSTAHLLYKYCTNCTVCKLNCTYSNYTEAVATCSAVHQHITFTVQILYKLHSLQLNCTYSNYTRAAATCSAAQPHTNCPTDVFWSAVHPAVLNYAWISMYTLSHLFGSELSN